MKILIYLLLPFLLGNVVQIVQTKRPVIIFPGLASNSLWHVPGPKSCFQFDRLWFSAASMLFVNPCWEETMKLRYIKLTNRVEDAQTPIKLHYFGTLHGIEDIGENGIYTTSAMIYKPMVDYLEQHGYRKNDTIRAIPMDWRRAVTDFHENYYEDVLSELRTANHRTGKKATLICHSYGCINLTQFIRKSNADEISGYIHKIITLGAPWKGSTKALKGLLNGDNLGIESLISAQLQPTMKTFTSLVNLIPDADILADFNPFVIINGKSYTNLAELLEKFGIDSNILTGRNNITSMIDAFGLLNSDIKIYCVYGANDDAISRLVYKGPKGLRMAYKIKEQRDGKGDGTVPLKSLEACKGKPYITETKSYDVEHQDMLKDDQVLDFIVKHIN